MLRALNDYHLISLSQDFGETVNIKAEVDEEAAPQIREKIKNATRGEILGEEIVKHNE
ncbi:MAG: hypothetical protein U5N56_02445 [Candidatus Marinimicrobia bacterium]|nr:hypothetical protein [Candidatus Neomarinimicrobiota bacterium]